MLYVVSTPIGNLRDLSFRAVEILAAADIIAAEDTRRTKILLNHYKINYKSIISYNDSNRERRIPMLIGAMKSGRNVALVSDAGTPGISDPGFRLIREAIRNGIQVIPIPGPSAIISALVCSGLPTDAFAFHGFFPKKEGQKIAFLNAIRDEKTVVVYESPYRIHKTLELMQKIMPEKRVCLCREMTKMFEEFLRGTPSEILHQMENKKIKGEIVLVIG